MSKSSSTPDLGLLDPKPTKVVQDQRIRTPKAEVERVKRARERKRLLAVTHYLITGSLIATHQITKVPYNTLSAWKRSDWWPNLEAQVLKKNKLVRSARMASLADKAQAVVAERLRNGDFQYDAKKGEIVRVPVKAAVANKILQDSTTAELQIIKQIEKTQEVQTQERMIDKLLAIKIAFREAAQKTVEKGANEPTKAISMVETTPGTFEAPNPPESP